MSGAAEFSTAGYSTSKLTELFKQSLISYQGPQGSLHQDILQIKSLVLETLSDSIRVCFLTLRCSTKNFPDYIYIYIYTINCKL